MHISSRIPHLLCWQVFFLELPSAKIWHLKFCPTHWKKDPWLSLKLENIYPYETVDSLHNEDEDEDAIINKLSQHKRKVIAKTATTGSCLSAYLLKGAWQYVQADTHHRAMPNQRLCKNRCQLKKQNWKPPPPLSKSGSINLQQWQAERSQCWVQNLLSKSKWICREHQTVANWIEQCHNILLLSILS